MLKITFNSSNTWGRQANSACNWPKPCRGDWAVPVLVVQTFPTPLVRDATEDWERNFPSCSFATFSAPCAVAVGKETGRGQGESKTKIAAGICGTEELLPLPRERQRH